MFTTLTLVTEDIWISETVHEWFHLFENVNYIRKKIVLSLKFLLDLLIFVFLDSFNPVSTRFLQARQNFNVFLATEYLTDRSFLVCSI